LAVDNLAEMINGLTPQEQESVKQIRRVSEGEKPGTVVSFSDRR
jgi:hypothetical protein